MPAMAIVPVAVAIAEGDIAQADRDHGLTAAFAAIVLGVGGAGKRDAAEQKRRDDLERLHGVIPIAAAPNRQGSMWRLFHAGIPQPGVSVM